MTRNATIEITPFDTLMFRDGRPFNQNDPGAAVAVSVFPPLPPTVVGAIRNGLWNLLGGAFPTEKLGDGTNWQEDGVLKALQFGSLRLRKDKIDYVPVPLHLLCHPASGEKPERLDMMKVEGKIQTDLGELSLPQMPTVGKDDPRPKQLEDHWISLGGLADLQNGDLPSTASVLPSKDLYKVESRVGIGIDRETSVTIDGQLYMASHIRLQDDVKLVIDVQGLPEGLPKHIHFTTAFGGEGRSAGFIETTENKAIQPSDPAERIAVTLLAPADLTGVEVRPGKELVQGYNLDTVCSGKPILAGGWDFKAKRPIPLRQLVPAGSVFFMTRTADITELPQSIGRATEWGFGQCCVLPWPKGVN